MNQLDENLELPALAKATAGSCAIPLHTLWIGKSLGPIERACLRSAMRQGHAMILYCYDRPDCLPEGVEVRDASLILPRHRIVTHRNGSPALFANLFRYELQRRGIGTWIDTDIYLLQPIPAGKPFLFAWESSHKINTAVLRLPADSALLSALLKIFDEREVPFWIPLRERLAARFRRFRTGRTDLSRMPWGVAGPNALTALAKLHGLTDAALPTHIFYPVHWTDATWILRPETRLEDVICEDTIAVHLWNEAIREWKDLPAPPGSFLERLQREGQ